HTGARGWLRPAVAAGVFGTVVFGLFWLCPPRGQVLAQAPTTPPATAPAASSDYGSRVVAYIYGNIPVTREELGEYLIERYAHEKLDLLINKKIIDRACAARGISVTAAEIEADIQATFSDMQITQKDFIDKVLKARGITMFEWKEDVVRPKLLL